MYRNSANIEADTASAASCTPVKAGLRNSCSGSIGSFTRLSMAMNATSRAAAPPSSETMIVEPQPSSLPRSSPKTSRNSAELKVTSPAQSMREALGSRALAQLRVGHDDRRDADRHVQEEDRLPAERVDEGAAHERADRHRHADGGAVDAHRHAAFAAGRELLGHERERDGEHDRAADALHGARDVQEGRIRSQAGGQRGDREDPEAGSEHAPAAEPVGQRRRR